MGALVSVGSERDGYGDRALLEGLYGEDYLYFYEDYHADDVSEKETELIVKLLGICGGEDVLDLPCGMGRIALRLAARGCRVVGVDFVEAQLDLARAQAAAAGVTIDYRQGDMRLLAADEKYDVAINWFTSFGNFDDATNSDVLVRYATALRPGGKLLLEVLHPERFFVRFPPRTWESRGVYELDDDVLVDRYFYDAATGALNWKRTLVRAGVTYRFDYQKRTYRCPEIKALLLAAGFSSAEAFDEQGRPFQNDSLKLIVVAQK